VPWTGAEILVVLILTPVWASFVAALLQAIGFYDWFYGPDLVALARDTGPDVDSAAQRLAQARLLLWSGCLGFGPQFSSVLGVMYLLSGTRPRDLGLTTRRLGINLLAGLLTAFALVPACYALNALVVQLHGEAAIQEHPFTRLGQAGLAPIEWALLGLAATVIAPLSEELLFRGILQPWFATRSWGGHLAMGLAFVVALTTRADLIHAAGWDGTALLKECVPLLCLLGLVPVYLLICWRSRSPVGPALFGTAVLFGWVHARVWPSPVPLALLGLALGYLAYRTQSLVGPIVLHGAFNATAFFVLLSTAFSTP
jgi:membrane protease YdiL (CAAX protease family)